MQPKDILRYFAKYIESELGIIYAEHNYFQLQNRLEEICRFFGIADMNKLYERAQKDVPEDIKQFLLDVATNNETSFFRDPKVFNVIEKVVLPSLSEQLPQGKKIRIWSAGSSTGQEALSVAILIKEFCCQQKMPVNFSILATDISERVLERARSGYYSQLDVQRGLSSPLLLKYFKKDVKDKWVACPLLRGFIDFKKMNLKSPFKFDERFHLVLCRNVLIYQAVEAKKEILSRLTEQLLPGGFLVLGSGESLIGISSDYEQVSHGGAIIYRKKSPLYGAA